MCNVLLNWLLIISTLPVFCGLVENVIQWLMFVTEAWNQVSGLKSRIYSIVGQQDLTNSSQSDTVLAGVIEKLMMDAWMDGCMDGWMD